MFKKKWMYYVSVITCVAMLAGCGGSPAAKSSDDGAGSKSESNTTDDKSKESSPSVNTKEVTDLSEITIGASVMSLQHEFMANLVKGYEEFQKQTGVKILITDGGNMEPEKQVSNVENYISQNVDGILCQCISVETMKDTLKQAMDKGIPVGIYPYDTSVGATTYFGYNEYEWGEKLGESASDWIKTKLGGKAKIINITTSLEEAAIERCKGWTDKINELCGEDSIDWNTVEATSASDAMTAAESALQANPDVDLLLVYNDEMGIGVYEAVKQSGLDTTNMFIGSCDGTDTVLDYVQEDTVYRCTVGNDRYVSEIGYYWVQNMVKISLGMEYEDPFPITTIAIDVDNVEEYRSREASYVLDEELQKLVKN
ncbi:MAG TPA: sugar ABC transporter substrate-binding protein [Candidatus Pelethocola excrementipullorum]|nr:sugar ABC transporter substrate-binding protein [Candidatus Pelethocola excrementipullorum]